MREIGGYFELDSYGGRHYYTDSIPLNCGRGCIKYLVELRKIKTIWLPDYMCNSVGKAFKDMGTKTFTYMVNENFLPEYDFELNEEEWLFLNDYYGQLKNKDIEIALGRSNGRLIVDETQGFFNTPYEGVDTFFSCRKWFGVSDGAFLITGDGERLERKLDRDESHNRMEFVLGRFERTASEYFEKASSNNSFFENEPAKKMSAITDNLLRAINYGDVINKRRENWDLMDYELNTINNLDINKPHVPFMYPLMIKKGDARFIRNELVKKKIYIPVLWPDVIERVHNCTVAYKFASDILPLPIDQRYSKTDIKRVVESIREIVG